MRTTDADRVTDMCEKLQAATDSIINIERKLRMGHEVTPEDWRFVDAAERFLKRYKTLTEAGVA